MKIVDLKTFLTLPKGTVFQKYEPCAVEDISILDSKCGEIDFFYQSVDGLNLDCSGSDEMVEILDKSEKTGGSFNLDFNCIGRDGCFEEKQLFLVWESKDITDLISRLTEALEDQKVQTEQ